MDKNLTVYKSDERMYFLERLLADQNFERDTHIFAPNKTVDEGALSAVKDGGLVVLGKCTDGARELASKRNITLANIMKDERFQAVNSRLSAEGALMLLMQHSLKSIAECYVLVMGFGRMGAAVANLLNKLGVAMDIATSSSLRPAYAFAKRAVPLNRFDFSPYDAIINTVPLPIVKDSELLSMKQGAVYLDLASVAAINLEYAAYLGIDADIYPALPAKICPVSAAIAMQEYILEVKND